MTRVLLIAGVATGLCLGQQGVARGRWEAQAQSQSVTSDGHVYHLRGHAELRGSDLVFRADQIDYDEIKGIVHLAGQVTVETKDKGTLRGDEADFDVNSGDLRLIAKLAPPR